MSAFSKSILLFVLNWLDAQLTLFWIRANLATEGNGFMNRLLEHGDVPFLAFKLAVGGFAAYVLYRCSNYVLARRGMTLVLGIYLGLMVIHAATGISALSPQTPATLVAYLNHLHF